MLLWMICCDELTPYFKEGTSTEIVSASTLIFRAKAYNLNGAEREKVLREKYEGAVAERLLKSHEGDVEQTVVEFAEASEPFPVRAGYFVLAKEISWEKGVVESLIYHPDQQDGRLFGDDDPFLGSVFMEKEFSLYPPGVDRQDNPPLESDRLVILKGMCFERDIIEMLQPQFPLEGVTEIAKVPSARVGRPRLWDWDGAKNHLLKIAQTPDGLPTGPGSQAEIERLLSEWFLNNHSGSPAESQLRKEAAAIVATLKTPKSP